MIDDWEGSIKNNLYILDTAISSFLFSFHSPLRTKVIFGTIVLDTQCLSSCKFFIENFNCVIQFHSILHIVQYVIKQNREDFSFLREIIYLLLHLVWYASILEVPYDFQLSKVTNIS